MSKMLALKKPTSAPESEYSSEFLQGMVDRMCMAFHSYGLVADAYPKRVDALACARARMKKYELTGNTEFLIDMANFCMIEFMHPRHPEAHFRPTDSRESPGRKWRDSINPSKRKNTEL